MDERSHPLLMTCGMIAFATAIVCLGVSVHFLLDYIAGGRNPYPRTQVFVVPASAPVEQPAPQVPPATATPIHDPKVGDVVTVGNWQYQVSHLDRQKTVVWSEFNNKTDAKGIWQIVHVKMMNVGKQTYPINDWDFELHDSNGIVYKTDGVTSSEYSQFHKLSATGDNYPPNVPAEIGLLFDVDPNATGLRLYLVQAKTFIRLEQ